MVTEELLSYIKRQKANHVPEESIRAILLSNGWLKIDVDKAFDALFKVQESAIVTSQDLRSKVSTFSPPVQKEVSVGMIEQGSNFVAPARSPLSQDSYREPINDAPKEQFTSKGVGTQIGTGLSDDLKARLKKISSDSIFAPQKEIVNPVMSQSNPLISGGAQVTPSFQELIESSSAEGAPVSNFPIKRDTIASQPLSALHMIEDKPLAEPVADPNRLYSRFSGGSSPYSPSVDKFNNPLVSIPQKKSHTGMWVFIFLMLGLVGGGYYLYTYKPDFVRSVIDKIASQSGLVQEKDSNNTPAETQQETQSPETVQPTPQEKPVDTNTTPDTTLPNIESTLKEVASKVPTYISAKSTSKGVCSNISSGIAKDIISLKQSYGSTVSCVDDATGFALAVPYQTAGEFMCIDSTSEIVLIKSPLKNPRCI